MGRLAECEHLKVSVIYIEGVDVEAELIVEPRGLGAEVEAVEPLGLDEERRLRGILRLAGVGARLVAAIVTQIEALAGLGLDRQDRAPRRLGEARLRLESIKRTREEGESEALAGGSIVQRLLEYALAVVSQAPAERQFPDRRDRKSTHLNSSH